MMTPSARNVCQKAFFPLLSERAWNGLQRELEEGGRRLIQGATTSPPPLQCLQDWPCESACAIGYTGLAEGLETIGEVEEYFASVAHAIDTWMGEHGAVRNLINWWDETPREEAIADLLDEMRSYIREEVAA